MYGWCCGDHLQQGCLLSPQRLPRTIPSFTHGVKKRHLVHLGGVYSSLNPVLVFSFFAVGYRRYSVEGQRWNECWWCGVQRVRVPISTSPMHPIQESGWYRFQDVAVSKADWRFGRKDSGDLCTEWLQVMPTRNHRWVVGETISARPLPEQALMPASYLPVPRRRCSGKRLSLPSLTSISVNLQVQKGNRSLWVLRPVQQPGYYKRACEEQGADSKRGNQHKQRTSNSKSNGNNVETEAGNVAAADEYNHRCRRFVVVQLELSSETAAGIQNRH